MKKMIAVFVALLQKPRIVHLNENVQKRRTDAEQLKCASLFGVAPVQNTHLITSDIPPPRL